MDKPPAGAMSGELEALRQNNAELEARNGRLCLYIERLVHDLKTPLTPLLGASEMLAAAVKEKHWADLAQSVYMSAENLLRMVEELLDLEKCERGLMELDCSDIDATALINEAIDGHRDAASAGRLDFTAEIPPSLPPVRADGARLRQVVDTLLSNAVRNTPGGGRVFIVAVIENGRLQVSVGDTGIEIAEDERRDIFQGYPDSGTKISRNNGNGLALAKRLVELHGGEISASKSAGVNNVFRFNIPIDGVRSFGTGAT